MIRRYILPTQPSKKLQKRGFTIVELLVIIVIVVILATLTAVSYSAVTRNANKQTVSTDAQAAASQLDKYKAKQGSYPLHLAAIGEISSIQSAFQYSYTLSTGKYCLTATHDGAAMYIESGTSAPKEGTCPSHGTNGNPLITNLVKNPSVTSLGTFATSATAANDSLMTNGGFSGSTYMRREFTASTANGIQYGTSTATYVPVEYGKEYMFSVFVRTNKVMQQSLSVRWFNSTGGSLAVFGSAPVFTAGPNWTRLAYTATAPQGDVGFPNSQAAYALVQVRAGGIVAGSGTWSAGDYLDVDSLMVTQGGVLHDYIDGTRPGCEWTGVANSSTSLCK